MNKYVFYENKTPAFTMSAPSAEKAQATLLALSESESKFEAFANQVRSKYAANPYWAMLDDGLVSSEQREASPEEARASRAKFLERYTVSQEVVPDVAVYEDDDSTEEVPEEEDSVMQGFFGLAILAGMTGMEDGEVMCAKEDHPLLVQASTYLKEYDTGYMASKNKEAYTKDTPLKRYQDGVWVDSTLEEILKSRKSD